jgi:hypothetical protein
VWVPPASTATSLVDCSVIRYLFVTSRDCDLDH